MSSIKKIVESCVDVNDVIENIEYCFHIVDNSGSTSIIFQNSQTVLMKELELLKADIISNKNTQHHLLTFESKFINHGQIHAFEDMCILPDICSGGGTYTHLPFEEIVKLIGKFKTPAQIILYTDGQTNSTSQNIIPLIKKIKNANIKLIIIAVSSCYCDFNKLTINEEKNIPGMDLINMCNNDIDKLLIYNKLNTIIPFEGIKNSTFNKNAIKFMDVIITSKTSNIHDFIHKFLDKINNTTIDFGENNQSYKQMLCDIGKIISILFVELDIEHIFIQIILDTIPYPANIDRQMAFNIINYGFSCTKKHTPIFLTNFEHHVKEATVKYTEFSDAINVLKCYGTTLNCKSITIPNLTSNICVINDIALNLTKSFDEYPNSMDNYNNVYFSSENPQAVRIALRSLCGKLGLQNARVAPDAIFHVSNIMSLMMIKGINMKSKYMMELRRLAIAQTSMQRMVSQGKYDTKGFYDYFKEGQIVQMHFSNPSTHLTLYTNKFINPLEQTQPIWWALQMTMLGLFDVQLNHFKTAIQSLNIEPTEENFINYMQNTFSQYIDGNFILDELIKKQSSLIDFDDIIGKGYILKQHLSSNNYICSSEICYSANDVKYVLQHGCLWCRYIPHKNQFDEIIIENNDIKLRNINERKSSIKILPIPANLKYDSTMNFSNLNIKNNANKYRILMHGTIGSGKSTSSLKLQTLLKQKNIESLIINTDKWQKKGIKNCTHNVKNEITNFIRKNITKNIVIIFDICNENSIVDIMFECDFSDYKTISLYPNYDENDSKFELYKHWSLRNVLQRGKYSEQTLHYINPIDAGINTCIKVHNLKTCKISNLLNLNTSKINESFNMQSLLNFINNDADEYGKYLDQSNLIDKQLIDVIDKITK
jgi:hypothetical protein